MLPMAVKTRLHLAKSYIKNKIQILTLLLKRKILTLENKETIKYVNFYNEQCRKTMSLDVENTFEQYEKKELDQSKVERVKHIALYLPQFHTVPENDKWWGKNYTEWNNLVRGFPQYVGHYQPHLPHDVGFYNLLDEDVLKHQVEIAKNYGIFGFCYYYYWFNGRKILEKPLELLLKSDVDMPFCIFYANDGWTRTWHGFSQDGQSHEEVLLEQNHNDQDDINFIENAITLFKDKRYIKIKNKPLFIIYHTHLYDDFKKTSQVWREKVKEAGFDDLLLLNVQMPDQENSSPVEIGTDAMMQFSPICCLQEGAEYEKLNPYFDGVVHDYEKLVESEIKREFSYPVFRGVFPSWDNEARRPGKGISYKGSSPELFYEYLKNINDFSQKNRIDEESVVFVNAWNEWAEGAHMEPDKKYGYSFLNRVAKVIEERNDK